MPDNDDIEIDLTNVPDRYAEHLRPDPDEIEIPPYWESEKDIDELYSSESLGKAFKLVRSSKVESAGRPGLYQVHGSELYVCTVIELEGSKTPGITCTCPNGSNRSGRPTCYHTAAVLMVHTERDIEALELKMAGFPEVPPEVAP